LKPATNTLTEVFNSAVRYIVPLYQRPYVWEKDRHWEPLWEDVLVVVDHYLDGADEPARHFLGAIVLDQEDTTPGEAMLRLVIDGQQRLTTLQLLLAAAARCAEQDGAEKQSRLLGKLVANDPDLTAGDARFKVWPTNANQAAFREVMQEGGPSQEAVDDPNNTIQEAYEYFSGVIRGWVHADDPQEDEVQPRHEALRIALSDLLQIVSINLEAGDNAQVIFETLNARGTPLLAMDLVKNAVFYRAQREDADVDQLNASVWEPQLGDEYWRESVRQGRLNRPRAELFLMHWLAMKLGRLVPATELFSEFRTHVLDAADGTDMDALIRELCRDASVLRSFEEQPAGSVEERFFRHLNVLDTTTVMPVALLLYRSDQITADQRRIGLTAMESWLVRRALCGYTTRGYNRLIGDLLKAVKADLEHADRVIVDFLRSSSATSAVWPSDEPVTEVLTGRGLYGWVNQRRLVMVLSAVELALRGNSKVEDIFALPTNLTLEHIMPRTWKDHWPLLDEVDSEAREARIDRLGNLTLTSGPLNSSLSNAPWEQKRPALSASSLLLLNKHVTEHEAWNEDTIDARGHALASSICSIWPGPTAEVWPSSSRVETTEGDADGAPPGAESRDGLAVNPDLPPSWNDFVQAVATERARAVAQGDRSWNSVADALRAQGFDVAPYPASGSVLRRAINEALAMELVPDDGSVVQRREEPVGGE
jgi:uncharacterized protein DUF262/uncharacterized protein DUF1524